MASASPPWDRPNFQIHMPLPVSGATSTETAGAGLASGRASSGTRFGGRYGTPPPPGLGGGGGQPGRGRARAEVGATVLGGAAVVGGGGEVVAGGAAVVTGAAASPRTPVAAGPEPRRATALSAATARTTTASSETPRRGPPGAGGAGEPWSAKEDLLGQGSDGKGDAAPGQERLAPVDGLLPDGQIGQEVGSIAVFVGVLELVERRVFGIEQGPVPAQEVLVDHL